MKRLRGIVLLLAAGAILNALVAWGLALFVNMNDPTVFGKSTNELGKKPTPYSKLLRDHVLRKSCRVSSRRLFGAKDYFISDVDHIYFTLRDKSTWNTVQKSWAIDPTNYLDRGLITFDELPTWVQSAVIITEHPNSQDGYSYSQTLASGRGWPFLSFSYIMTRETERRNTSGGIGQGDDRVGLNGFDAGYVIESKPWPDGRRRVIPVHPAMPSFVANTAFYAIMLWLPFFARRMNRRLRGRCPACGYDLRKDLQAGCPECGWRRERSIP